MALQPSAVPHAYVYQVKVVHLLDGSLLRICLCRAQKQILLFQRSPNQTWEPLSHCTVDEQIVAGRLFLFPWLMGVVQVDPNSLFLHLPGADFYFLFHFQTQDWERKQLQYTRAAQTLLHPIRCIHSEPAGPIYLVDFDWRVWQLTAATGQCAIGWNCKAQLQHWADEKNSGSRDRHGTVLVNASCGGGDIAYRGTRGDVYTSGRYVFVLTKTSLHRLDIVDGTWASAASSAYEVFFDRADCKLRWLVETSHLLLCSPDSMRRIDWSTGLYADCPLPLLSSPPPPPSTTLSTSAQPQLLTPSAPCGESALSIVCSWQIATLLTWPEWHRCRQATLRRMLGNSALALERLDWQLPIVLDGRHAPSCAANVCEMYSLLAALPLA